MDNAIHCKSCNYTMTKIEKECPNCGIPSPMKTSNKKRKIFYIGIACFIVLIVVIPMVASLLWMQSK